MKILLIEDDELNQEFLLDYMMALGYLDFMIVTTLNDATSYVSVYKPDLVISEVHLVEHYCFDLFKNKLLSHVPRVFIATLEDIKKYSTLINKPKTIFLSKPFQLRDLQSAINRLIPFQ